jgi:hypothetical protein
MQPRWVRSYRPNPDRLDERPAVLSGGYVTADPELFETIVTAALVKRGNVVIQQTRYLYENEGAFRARVREAERAEARP